jgi:hypothetical protein
MKHELTTLQAKSVPKQGKLTRSPGYEGYCIKHKQRWDSEKIAVSNTSNIEVRFMKYKSLLYQIQATRVEPDSETINKYEECLFVFKL